MPGLHVTYFKIGDSSTYLRRIATGRAQPASQRTIDGKVLNQDPKPSIDLDLGEAVDKTYLSNK